MTGEVRDYLAFPVPFTTGPISNPITAAGNTGNLNIETWATLTVVIDITAFSATNITFSVDEYDPTSNKFVSLATSGALVATGTTRMTPITLTGQFIRLSWTGTALVSITCTVSFKLRAA